MALSAAAKARRRENRRKGRQLARLLMAELRQRMAEGIKDETLAKATKIAMKKAW